MSEGLVVAPAVTAVFAHRKASSSCCGAPLDVSTGLDASTGEEETAGWMCTECGQLCDRVLSGPREVTAGG